MPIELPSIGVPGASRLAFRQLMNRHYTTRCASAGAAWGAIAYLLANQAFGSATWAGVLASPIIGLAIGSVVLLASRAPTWFRVISAGISLYGAAALFGCVVGMARLLTRHPSQNAEVFIEHVLATLWGVTFTGYCLVLWPIAFVTQERVLSAATARDSKAASAGDRLNSETSRI